MINNYDFGKFEIIEELKETQGGIPFLSVSILGAFWGFEEGKDGLIAEYFEGGLQIIINGTKNGYKELGKYFLALSELDISEDPDFHEHIDNLVSFDGKTNLQLIFGKED